MWLTSHQGWVQCMLIPQTCGLLWSWHLAYTQIVLDHLIAWMVSFFPLKSRSIEHVEPKYSQSREFSMGVLSNRNVPETQDMSNTKTIHDQKTTQTKEMFNLLIPQRSEQRARRWNQDVRMCLKDHQACRWALCLLSPLSFRYLLLLACCLLSSHVKKDYGSLFGEDIARERLADQGDVGSRAQQLEA